MTPPRPLWRGDLPLVALLSVIAALSFGASYGDVVSNQTTYLPKGMQLANPTFLARDWWLNETVQYHVAFSRLVQFLFLAGAPHVSMVAANTLLIVGSLVMSYLLVPRLGVGRVELLAWSFVVGVFFLGLNASTVGVTCLFSVGLQPSTIATFCFLTGMLLFLESRNGLSGLALGVGGAFHLNFVIVGLACFGLAQLSLGRRGLIRRLAWQQGPMLLVLAANIPLVMAMEGGGTPEERRLAADIFFHVAEPFHYDPLSYLPMFLPFVAWHVLAIVDLPALPAGPRRSRLRALYLSMLTIITGAVALTSVTFVVPVARAFFFRLNPFAVLIACVVVATAAAYRLSQGDRATSGMTMRGTGSARETTVALVRFAAAVTIVGFAWRFPVAGPLQSALVTLPLAFAALIPVLPDLRSGRLSRAACVVGRRPVLAGIILVVVATGAASDPKHFEPLTGPYDDHTAGLRRWAAATPATTLFLTPPDMVEFRFWTGRAIVVDSKAVPQGTQAVLAWYRRMEDVSGRPGFRSLDEAAEGYRQMDAARLDALARTYHPDYVVLPNTGASWGLGGDAVFADPWFLVLRWPDRSAARSASAIESTTTFRALP